MTTAKTEKAHAKFSASSAKRWRNCPGSVALSLKAPPSLDSVSSIAGTECHEILAYLVENIKKPLAAEAFASKKWGTERVLKLAPFAKKIVSRIGDGDLLIEQKIDADFLHPETGGTVDYAIIDLFGTLEIIDYKNGVHPVDAIENEQMLIYCLGIAHKYDYNFENYKMTILQPNSLDGEGPFKEWEINGKELKKWKSIFQTAIKKCEEKKAPLVYNKSWCHFCPAACICPELNNKAFEAADCEFNEKSCEIKLPAMIEKPGQLDVEKLGKTLLALEKLDTWKKTLFAHAYALAERGHKIPGWDYTKGRCRRQWFDYDKVIAEAVKKFGREKSMTISELKSPAQMEIVAGKEWVKDRVANIVGASVLVPSEGNTRETVNSAAQDFEGVVIKKSKKEKRK